MDTDLIQLSDETLETLESDLHAYRQARQARQANLRALEAERLALGHRRAVLDALRALQEAIRQARAAGIDLSLPDIGLAAAAPTVPTIQPPISMLETSPDEAPSKALDEADVLPADDPLVVTPELDESAPDDGEPMGIRLEYKAGQPLNGGGLLGDRGEWSVMDAAEGGWLPDAGASPCSHPTRWPTSTSDRST